MKRFQLLCACVLAVSPVFGQLPTYPGCPNLVPADFQTTEVFNRSGAGGAVANGNLAEPIQFDMRGIWNGGTLTAVDVYFIERVGAVKYYNGATRTVTQLGIINNWARTSGPTSGNDNGLMGIAVDPNFASNRYLYFWYSPPIANANLNRRLRLSRFTVDAGNTSIGSEKIMIDILASKTDQWHSGGPMTFDAYGDLWISVGNNSRDVNAGGAGSHYSTTDSSNSAEWGSSNTASMRGGILRIHPDNSALGYTVPAGNFGEYWGQYWQNQGNATRAAQYRNPSLVLPENYVKGSRSNFSVTVHPTKRWLAWAEVNFDASSDEFNIATTPVFGGFPYFHANNNLVPSTPQTNPALPRNTSPLNSGVQDLPPSKAGNLNNMANMNVSISGPIYAFDRNLNTTNKFPPHFHQSWILMAFTSGQMHLAVLDTNNVTVQRTVRLDQTSLFGATFRNPINAEYGPDGALYVMNYSGNYGTFNNPGLMRVNYVGNCVVTPIVSGRGTPPGDPDVSLTSAALVITQLGGHAFRLYDLSGQLLLTLEGSGSTRYSFADLRARHGLKKGVYVARVTTARGAFVRNLSLL